METVGIIDSFDEWESIINNIQHLVPGTYNDFDNARLLVDQCNIKHFMEAPVALFEGHDVAAFSGKSSSIEEIVKEFNKLANEGNQIFLYMLTNCTFNSSSESWVVRYGIVKR
jgi:hypothetical protein